VRETKLGQAQLIALEERVSRLESDAAARRADRGAVVAVPRGQAATAPDPRGADPSAAAEPAHTPTAPPGGAITSSPAPPTVAETRPPQTAEVDGTPDLLGGDASGPNAAGDGPGTAAAGDGVDWWLRNWNNLLEAVNRRDRALAGVLRDCRPVAADATSLTVGALYRFHLERLREPARLEALTVAAAEVAGAARVVDTTYAGKDEAPPVRTPGATGETTQAVLDAFAGSRVTSSRLREDSNRPTRGGAA
jgi:hypothetical protein